MSAHPPKRQILGGPSTGGETRGAVFGSDSCEFVIDNDQNGRGHSLVYNGDFPCCQRKALGPSHYRTHDAAMVAPYWG